MPTFNTSKFWVLQTHFGWFQTKCWDSKLSTSVRLKAEKKSHHVSKLLVLNPLSSRVTPSLTYSQKGWWTSSSRFLLQKSSSVLFSLSTIHCLIVFLHLIFSFLSFRLAPHISVVPGRFTAVGLVVFCPFCWRSASSCVTRRPASRGFSLLSY